MDFVRTRREQRRAEHQLQARMLHSWAALICSAFNGKLPPVWEVFPFWTEAEIQEINTEQIRQMLMGLAPQDAVTSVEDTVTRVES